jgi:DNA-directed RNA polymerase specialized sigma24 family protein
VIDRLPPRCQAILQLRYRLGYDAAEVAARLGYSPASMGKVTTRCLAALTRQLTLAGLLDGTQRLRR